MNEDIKKDIDKTNANDELDVKDLDNVNGGAWQGSGSKDPHHR